MEKEPTKDTAEQVKDLLEQAKEKGILAEIISKKPRSEEAKRIFMELELLEWNKSAAEKQED
ncbi:MAG: hypothetical protein PHN37_00050 [Candidatus Pacebacteria bacterium]|nr:hypothetical protein [Candidatus Paceibacterota bacterium]